MTDYTDFFIQKPTNVYRIKTVELYSSDFGVIRMVSGFTDRALTLESDAPRNAGETVTFSAIDLTWNDPALTDEANISTSVSFSRIGTQARAMLKTITDVGALNGMEVVLREYLSNDLTAPKIVYYLYTEAVSVSGPDVSIPASDTNPNLQNTSQVYTLDKFPGLETI